MQLTPLSLNRHLLSSTTLSKLPHPLSPSPQPENTTSHFPSTGLPSDQILNTAFEKKIISSDGRVIDPSFDIGSNLDKEIKATGVKISQKSQNDKIRPKLNHLPPIKAGLYETIRRFKTSLNEPSEPEIIGSAVPFFLGEDFYIQYLVARLNFSQEQARQALRPLLQLLLSTPNDIDCRLQISAEDHPAFASTQDCKYHMAKAVCSLPDNQALNKKKQLQPKTPPELIKANYFTKLSFVSEKEIKYGIARFGEFLDRIPLEMILVQSLTRPYITLHKSPKLILHSPHDRTSKSPLVELAFPESLKKKGKLIHPETTIFQQTAMILDAPDLDGVDWRGFVSVLIEMTKGYRTLSVDLLNGLWNSFKRNEKSLEEKIQWGVENHLPPENKDPHYKQKTFAYYLTILLYLIDYQPEEEEAILVVFTKINETALDPSSSIHPNIELLRAIFSIANLSPHQSLAWFRLALWLQMEKGIAPETLSINHGTLCHRFVDPISKTIVWIPLVQPNTALHIAQSVDNIDIDLIGSLLVRPQSSHEPENYSLSQFTQWIDLDQIRNIISGLLPRFRDLALKLELSLLHLSGETSIPDYWIKELPYLPLETAQTLLPLLNVDQPLSPSDLASPHSLLLHLISTNHPSVLRCADDLIAGCPAELQADTINRALTILSDQPELFIQFCKRLTTEHQLRGQEIIHRFLLSQFVVRLDLSEFNLDLLDLPWVVLSLHIGEGGKGIRLQTTPNKPLHIQLQFTDNQWLTLPYFEPDFSKLAIDRFNSLENTDQSIQVFLKVVQTWKFSKRSLLANSESTKELARIAHRFFSEPLDTAQFKFGYKLKIMKLGHTESSASLAVDLLRKFPVLREVSSEANLEVSRAVSINGDRGSQKLASLITGEKDIDQNKFIIALLCHARKECYQYGLELLKGLTTDQQEEIWHHLSGELLQHKRIRIPEIIDLLPHLNITPERQPQFFIEWIKKVRQERKNDEIKKLKGFLLDKFPSMFNTPDLRKTTNPQGWLDRASATVSDKSKSTTQEVSKFETPAYKRFARAYKLSREKDKSECFNYLMSLDLSEEEKASYEQIITTLYQKQHLTQIQRLQLFNKFPLTSQYRVTGPDYYPLVQALSLEEKQNPESYRQLLDLMSPQRQFGKALLRTDIPRDPEFDNQNLWGILLEFYYKLHPEQILQILEAVFTVGHPPSVGGEVSISTLTNNDSIVRHKVIIRILKQELLAGRLTPAEIKSGKHPLLQYIPRVNITPIALEKASPNELAQMIPDIIINLYITADPSGLDTTRNEFAHMVFYNSLLKGLEVPERAYVVTKLLITQIVSGFEFYTWNVLNFLKKILELQEIPQEIELLCYLLFRRVDSEKATWVEEEVVDTLGKILIRLDLQSFQRGCPFDEFLNSIGPATVSNCILNSLSPRSLARSAAKALPFQSWINLARNLCLAAETQLRREKSLSNKPNPGEFSSTTLLNHFINVLNFISTNFKAEATTTGLSETTNLYRLIYTSSVADIISELLKTLLSNPMNDLNDLNLLTIAIAPSLKLNKTYHPGNYMLFMNDALCVLLNHRDVFLANQQAIEDALQDHINDLPAITSHLPIDNPGPGLYQRPVKIFSLCYRKLPGKKRVALLAQLFLAGTESIDLYEPITQKFKNHIARICREFIFCGEQRRVNDGLVFMTHALNEFSRTGRDLNELIDSIFTNNEGEKISDIRFTFNSLIDCLPQLCLALLERFSALSDRNKRTALSLYETVFNLEAESEKLPESTKPQAVADLVNMLLYYDQIQSSGPLKLKKPITKYLDEYTLNYSQIMLRILEMIRKKVPFDDKTVPFNGTILGKLLATTFFYSRNSDLHTKGQRTYLGDILQSLSSFNHTSLLELASGYESTYTRLCQNNAHLLESFETDWQIITRAVRTSATKHIKA